MRRLVIGLSLAALIGACTTPGQPPAPSDRGVQSPFADVAPRAGDVGPDLHQKLLHEEKK